MLNAYYVSEDEIFAAHSAEEARAGYMLETGELCDEGYPRELTTEELDEPHPEFDEDERKTDVMTSVRQMLREHGSAPGFLAGTVGM